MGVGGAVGGGDDVQMILCEKERINDALYFVSCLCLNAYICELWLYVGPFWHCVCADI